MKSCLGQDFFYEDMDSLTEMLRALATDGNKHRAKVDKRKQRSVFRDVLRAVEVSVSTPEQALTVCGTHSLVRVQRGLRAVWVRASLSCGALRCRPALKKERAVLAKVAFRFPSHHRWSSCLCLKLPGNS